MIENKPIARQLIANSISFDELPKMPRSGGGLGEESIFKNWT